MTVLPLLPDGTCRIAGTCLNKTTEAVPQCPQQLRCGTCVAWSPLDENAYGRNDGTCMLNQGVRQALDCNAEPCPYYRPRRENPFHAEWQHRPRRAPKKEGGKRRRNKMGREAPPPSPEALAQAAFADFDAACGDVGTNLLAAELRAHKPLPVLLERFRGGSVRVAGTSMDGERETSVEAFFARIALLRRSLQALESAIDDSSLDESERNKVKKDISGMNGSLTTFNLLFKDRADAFRGAGKG